MGYFVEEAAPSFIFLVLCYFKHPYELTNSPSEHKCSLIFDLSLPSLSEGNRSGVPRKTHRTVKSVAIVNILFSSSEFHLRSLHSLKEIKFLFLNFCDELDFITILTTLFNLGVFFFSQ